MGEAVALFPPKTHPMYLLTYLAQKHSLPEIFYLDLWPIAPPQMIIISGEAAAQVSTLRPYPINTYVRDLLTPIIAQNIIPTANGSLWKMLHHILGPAFVPRYIKTLLGSITDEALSFHETLKVLANKEAFSMEEELSKVLFDIIGSIVFGFPLDAQKSGSQILTDLKYLLGSFQVSFSTWNPITKFRIRLKQRGATKRVNSYIEDKARERFAVMKDEKEPPTRRNASSILDRVLLEKIQDGGDRKEELDAEYLQLVVDKYVL
jgi:cytochrome P450